MPYFIYLHQLVLKIARNQIHRAASQLQENVKQVSLEKVDTGQEVLDHAQEHVNALPLNHAIIRQIASQPQENAKQVSLEKVGTGQEVLDHAQEHVNAQHHAIIRQTASQLQENVKLVGLDIPVTGQEVLAHAQVPANVQKIQDLVVTVEVDIQLVQMKFKHLENKPQL